MKNHYAVGSSIILLFAGAGCATTAAPAELVAARAAYTRAQQGPAAQYDPADLHTAEESLQAAEASFEKEGDTVPTRDLAYIAQRRVQIAEARAGAMQSDETQKKAEVAMHASQAAQLGAANQKLAVQGQELAVQGQELASERESRVAAEKRAAQAAADLQKFASVKQEPRGTVITLSGSVLFASSKSDLLPAAQIKLNSVADTLSQQDPDSKMIVEGHTDSQGGVSYNQDLSQRRAQTVRDYLVSRGIAADRVTAAGFGSSRSVADNNSPEGRANNRRVEIVIGPSASHNKTM